jgi:hypothetical protein
MRGFIVRYRALLPMALVVACASTYLACVDAEDGSSSGGVGFPPSAATDDIPHTGSGGASAPDSQAPDARDDAPTSNN